MTFQQIRGTIQAHDVRLESCDRDGQEFCDCLERAIDQTEATFAAALRELRASVAAERSALFAPILAEIDATIAKLGLEER